MPRGKKFTAEQIVILASPGRLARPEIVVEVPLTGPSFANHLQGCNQKLLEVVMASALAAATPVCRGLWPPGCRVITGLFNRRRRCLFPLDARMSRSR
jgi:hypothetical protein